jgi:hypothetical protein
MGVHYRIEPGSTSIVLNPVTEISTILAARGALATSIGELILFSITYGIATDARSGNNYKI